MLAERGWSSPFGPDTAAAWTLRITSERLAAKNIQISKIFTFCIATQMFLRGPYWFVSF
jgi:hypothetical protein